MSRDARPPACWGAQASTRVGLPWWGPTLAAAIVTLPVLAGGQGEALDSRRYWPNFDAVAKGYQLRATDGSGFVMPFVAFEGTQNFAPARSVRVQLGLLALAFYSLYTCDGLWLDQWYARPPNVTPQDLVPTIGPVSAGLSNKVFLDQDGSQAGVILIGRWRAYITAVGPSGIQLVSDQVWYDAQGVELGAIRETFSVGEVPLCEDAARTMPGVRRYTTWATTARCPRPRIATPGSAGRDRQFVPAPAGAAGGSWPCTRVPRRCARCSSGGGWASRPLPTDLRDLRRAARP